MDDPEIAQRALDYQLRGREVRLLDIPAYRRWSERKIREGASDALIAHLDATSMVLLPEEIGSVPESVFDELLEDLEKEFGG